MRLRKMGKRLSILIILWLLQFKIGHLIAQPAPGDGNLGAASGGTVGSHGGGGADLGSNILMFLLPALLYMIFKYRKQLFPFWTSLSKGL